MIIRASANPGNRVKLTQLLLFLCGLAALSASSALCQMSDPAKSADREKTVQDGERLLEGGRSTLDVPTLNSARKIFEACAGPEDKNSLCYFNLALTDFCLKKAEDLTKHSEAAKRWLDTAIADAQSAEALNERSPDIHALLGDLYGAKITGMASGMHYGPKANAEIQRAFQLDPDNSRAFAAAGRKYLYTPSMFGGDLNKAIESFRKATETDPHFDENFVWLAIAYRKKGDSVDAQQALSEALQLNSHNVFALRVKSGAEQ
jgi:tetratricopeptide (TPR) repeat protein